MPAIDVIICVHNALDDVRACLTSIRDAGYPADRLGIVIVDDGSAAETRDYVREAAGELAATLLRHEEPLGYTRSVNAGLGACREDADVTVLLNSDTIVPPGWLERMVTVFDARPDVGLVGPLSNAATWQSVPMVRDGRSWAINQLPEGASPADLDLLLQRVMGPTPPIPRVPVLNGFCLAIRNAVFERIGTFDAEAFPRGYGEENDFCFRAADAGFGLAVALNVYVYHAKSKSFGSEARKQLADAGREVLGKRYGRGRLTRASDTMRLNPALATVRDRFAEGLIAAGFGSPPGTEAVDAGLTASPPFPAVPSAVDRAPLSAGRIDHALRQILKAGTTGTFDLGGGATVEFIAPGTTKVHTHFQGSLPHSNGIEPSFVAGPVFALRVADAVADLETGLSLVDDGPLRGSAISLALVKGYAAPSAAQLAEAVATPEDAILPVATQRMRNYCRFWLDSVGKLYVAQVLAELGGSATPIMPPVMGSFQSQTFAALAPRLPVSVRGGRLIRSTVINSPGICYGGGQNISTAVVGFSDYLRRTILGDAIPENPPERIYVSRATSPFRRVLNEDDYLPALRDLGFSIVRPHELTLVDQAALFARAAVVVAPHGAALTNILFASRMLRIVEIFPDCGIHGSAFLRIASHLGLRYFYVAGASVENAKSVKNPNNADIVVDVPAFLSFMRDVVLAS